jgi:CBS domain-containing protein
MGVYQPEEEEDTASFQELAKKARAGSSIPVKLVQDLGKKSPFVTVSEKEGLSKVVEIFGSGVHRIAVVREGTDHVIGILSQLQLISFFWEHGRSFPAIDQLYPCSLRELNIGSARVISINGEKKVIEALELMNTEGISSVAVVDNHNNVVGNLSTTDVKYLTRASSLPLLRSTCLHFLSVILTDRGTANGQDSYPVFHVNPQSTLAHTVAKLVATKAHRMWLVESPSPASSAPPTPTLSHAMSIPSVSSTSVSNPTPYSPLGSAGNSGSRLSGQLIGVISLTDILNLFARSSGLSPVDPSEARKQRRRSSSSSMRMSFDIPRSSFELRRPPGAA